MSTLAKRSSAQHECRAPVASGGPALGVEALEVRYGTVSAVRGVNLEIGDGESLCIVGANGAGKTSLLSALAGVQTSCAGVVRWHGEEIQRRDLRWRIGKGIVYIPEGTQVFASMSVEENLEVPLLAMGRRVGRNAFDAVFETFPILRSRAKQSAGTLSGGENRMLAIARALVLEPDLLLVDEPSLGLAPKATEHLGSTLRSLTERGQTTLVSEQNLVCASAVGGRAALMVRGEIRWWGSASELHDVEIVRNAVLGQGLS